MSVSALFQLVVRRQRVCFSCIGKIERCRQATRQNFGTDNGGDAALTDIMVCGDMRKA